MNNDLLISVTAPVYNEDEIINDYISATLKVLKENFANYELVLIDDGSSDNSVEQIRTIQKDEKHLRLIRLSRNYGREIAMTAGFDNCIGDIVIVMDSDLQDPPELIPLLINKLREEQADICYAARTDRRDESWIKKTTSKLFYKICSSLTGFTIPDDAGDFRAMNRKVINSLIQVREKVRYMKMLYAYVGFKTTSIPFERQARPKGQTKYNYIKLIDAALDAIISNSHQPLRYVSISSILISLFMFILSLKGIFDKFLLKDIESGWASLFFITTLMFSILFIFLAIFAEYISRILTESKDRPLYYITEESHETKIHNSLNIVEDL